MPIRLCIFDAYGTLFDVTAAAREAAAEHEALVEHWPRIAADWRQKQLEYTWLRATAGQHKDFWSVTQDGLDWALEASGLSDPVLRKRLLQLYWELSAFPEVPDMLRGLKARGLPAAVLSNGTPEMLDAAVQSAGISDLLDAILSVESVGVFKPSPKVYDLVGQRYGTELSDVLFVSSNGWDSAAASAYGFRTLWVNRGNAPQERLWGMPDAVHNDLTRIEECL